MPTSTTRSPDTDGTVFLDRVLDAAPRVVGAGFAAAAVFNTVKVLPRSREVLQQFAGDAWVPPYRAALCALDPVATAVIAGVIGFEAIVACHLLGGRRTRESLRWTQAFTLGLIPALAWPYWPSNVAYAAAIELVLRGRSTGGGPA